MSDVGTAFYDKQDRATARFAGDGLVARRIQVGSYMVAFRRPSEWLRRAVTDLRRIQGYRENWDSYGALPVDPKSVACAQIVLSDLACVVGVDAPGITATPDGNIGLSWDDGTRSVDVEVLPNGDCAFVRIIGDSAVEGIGDVTSVALQLTNWR